MNNTKLARPTPQQMTWQDLELGMFFHFGINTFCDQEWGEGTDSPQLFNPKELDARQWIRTAKEAGFKYVILTAKHHDGFCLWPTNTTDYSVKSSPWKDGKGDVVREVADACREENMLLGLYVSPWDRNAPCYCDPDAYDDFYAEQLTELLTGYGPLVEVWFDGAGSEGHKYDWPRIMGLVKRHQPDAMVFNMGAPTIRWVGNEDGVAPYPCWNTAESARVSMFTSDMNTWMEETPAWVPAECDVPIRKRHWFWHPGDEQSLHSLEHLLDLYYRSVGHGTTLLLNVSPDNRGLLPEADVSRVLELGAEIRHRFGNPLSETRGSGNEIILECGKEQEIDHIVTMEDIAYGERVRLYIVEAEMAGDWAPIAGGSAIGHKKIDRIDPPVRTSRIRLRVLEAVESPEVRSLSVFGPLGRV
ncbi:alpha-L-fucosidase [Paenibacillus sp. LHD-38]|uniref:alpha-L-fucosidase n=1 Tax=Paenibacillus sp. LHD-38 TaxID=3072143 RepID=UPI00280D5A64|nr:alpha-L-fucosidase [Paenibacillus sp. LHD-38]MDQ8737621.1 alpha-L-fucosidase [Paenibacillus sp. LHD-38]